MCGIFGVISDVEPNLALKKINSDIKKFVKFSEKRGSDTFGVSLKVDDAHYVFKANENPSNAIKKDEYNFFLKSHLKDQIIKKAIVIGQTRLVTNGSKFSYSNNQPLLTDNIIGIHNGIFTNLEKNNKEKTINYESYDVVSDSLIFFENLSSIVHNENFIEEYKKYIININRNYSIAFLVKNESKLFLSSNCGSLYFYNESDFFCFASEKEILLNYLKNSDLYKNKNINYSKIKKCINETIIYDQNTQKIDILSHNNSDKVLTSLNINSESNLNVINNLDFKLRRINNLKKCSKCILPETYPFISFDEKNICNYCQKYEKQNYYGEKKLNEYLNKFRSLNGKPDCIVGLSGGRDSCYGLHLLKKKYNMNPIAYTFDWGLTTDVSRINAAKICGSLGIEHIIRSANIEQKRKFVNQNLFAWLNRPHLGMLPIIQAGDKGFYNYGRKLSNELGIDLVVHCTGYQLEQREFFLGFAGIKQKLKNNQRMYSYNFFNKLKMLYWYSLQFILNPAYINSALVDNFDGFLASFIRKDDFLHIYNYEPWNESEIKDVLINEYNWQDDISYGKNQWRMGDGQTAFNNFVYYTIAGFSEYDNFRSNQIREGLISRQEAVKLCKEDNKIKYDTLKNFSEVIGFNLDNVLSKISSLPKLY